jgi:hypothetical protein
MGLNKINSLLYQKGQNSEFSHSLAYCWTARHIDSIGQQFDHTWSARFAPNKRRVHAVHSLEVGLRLSVEDLKPGRSPRPPEEHPEATTICKRVANPMSTRTAFNDHEDSAAVIEISDRNAAPLPRATTAGLNDEGIVAVVWRPRHASKKPVGYPEEGVQVLLLDESGHAVGVGAVGQIAVKSRYPSLGYWRRPDLTQARVPPRMTTFAPGPQHRAPPPPSGDPECRRPG